MGVRAPDRGGAAVEHIAHRAFLARALGVEVHKDDLLLYLGHVPVGNYKGIVGVAVKREASYQVQHADITEGRGVYVYAASGALRAEVCRAEDLATLIEIGLKLRARPCVVAERDDVRAGAEDRIGLPRRDADDVCIFTVDDGKGDVLFLFVFFQALFQKIQTRLAAHVADRQYSYAHIYPSVLAESCFMPLFYHNLPRCINAFCAHNIDT